VRARLASVGCNHERPIGSQSSRYRQGPPPPRSSLRYRAVAAYARVHLFGRARVAANRKVVPVVGCGIGNLNYPVLCAGRPSRGSRVDLKTRTPSTGASVRGEAAA
jgi:hypothetical protein